MPRIVHTNSNSGLDDAATVDQILAQPGIGSVTTLSNLFSEWLSANPLNENDSIAIRWSRHGERKPGVKGIEAAKEMYLGPDTWPDSDNVALSIPEASSDEQEEVDGVQMPHIPNVTHFNTPMPTETKVGGQAPLSHSVF